MQVPNDYGINYHDIKYEENNKTEQLNARIKVLQDQNEALTEQNKELFDKYYKASEKYTSTGVRFKNVTPEQMMLIDEYANNLRNQNIKVPDDTKKDKNDLVNLRQQLEMYKKYDFKDKIDNILDLLQNKGQNVNMGDDFMDKILSAIGDSNKIDHLQSPSKNQQYINQP